MPAAAPDIPAELATHLAQLGSRIQAQRKRLRVSAVAAAEAAGMSRVTLHRIEKGEPSVAMGAYLSAAAALGLELTLRDTTARDADDEAQLPPEIAIREYPELRRLAWQMNDEAVLTPQEALNLYERNWRHVDRAALGERERALIHRLTAALGGGKLLV